MIRDCKNVGNPLPKFEEIGGGFSVTLKFNEPMLTVIEKKPMDTSKLTERQKKIIAILEQGPLHRQQLMASVGIKITDRTMQLELVKLKRLNLITSSGKGKATIYSLMPPPFAK